MHTGKVYLVGAGPGDPELLTRRAYQLIQTADIVLYDTLTGPAIRRLIPASVRTVHVGKRSSDGRRCSQAMINRLMVNQAQVGHRVVRLKGGDPSVFGRGGEEALYLASHNIAFEIVPGVSSVLAAPGIAGIPLTQRKVASSFTVITGHEDPSKASSALDWEGISRNIRAGGTLVILMGVKRLKHNIRALLMQDLPPDTPMAVIENASHPAQTILTGTLDTMPEQVRAAGIGPPAVFVVGDVVQTRERLLRASAPVFTQLSLPDRPAEAVDTPKSRRVPWALREH